MTTSTMTAQNRVKAAMARPRKTTGATAKARAGNGKLKAQVPTGGFSAADFKRAATRIKHASDPTRLRVLAILAVAEQNVGDICAMTGVSSQPSISHHLALLRTASLIESRRDGKNNVYSLTERGRALWMGLASQLAAS